MHAILIVVAVLGFLVCAFGRFSIFRYFGVADDQFAEGPLWTAIMALITVGLSSGAVLFLKCRK